MAGVGCACPLIAIKMAGVLCGYANKARVECQDENGVMSGGDAVFCTWISWLYGELLSLRQPGSGLAMLAGRTQGLVIVRVVAAAFGCFF